MEDFLQNFSDPKFRQLFHEYTKMVSDPVEREKFRQDIQLLKSMKIDLDLPTVSIENNPSNQQHILPSPAFCLSVKASVYHDYNQIWKKYYIKICHHPSVAPARKGRKCTHSHSHTAECMHHETYESKTGNYRQIKNGENYWEIPYSLIKPQKVNDTKIYTIIFSTRTYHLFLRDDQFKSTLIYTAMQAIQEKYSEKFDEKSFELLNFDDPKLLTGIPTVVKSLEGNNEVNVANSTDPPSGELLITLQDLKVTSNLPFELIRFLVDHTSKLVKRNSRLPFLSFHIPKMTGKQLSRDCKLPILNLFGSDVVPYIPNTVIEQSETHITIVCEVDILEDNILVELTEKMISIQILSRNFGVGILLLHRLFLEVERVYNYYVNNGDVVIVVKKKCSRLWERLIE
eukprot:TRINITY_DN5237_c0_g1_i2.p1 TRINITY_DN5237_c0_g1~~TRINITY_DN5237_c0_g1_i2.p1  ORF type:complete len:400 (+),score=41.37 TRINITY_DN5237_c0_g1_i2:2-1201(+)